MKIESIAALSFLLGGITGIAITAWVIFYPLPYWSDSSHFANFFPRVASLATSAPIIRCTARNHN
jgi:hypothetical protein